MSHYSIVRPIAARLDALARPHGLSVHYVALTRARLGTRPSARPWQLWSVHPRRGIVTGFRTAFASSAALEAYLTKLQQEAR